MDELLALLFAFCPLEQLTNKESAGRQPLDHTAAHRSLSSVNEIISGWRLLDSSNHDNRNTANIIEEGFLRICP